MWTCQTGYLSSKSWRSLSARRNASASNISHIGSYSRKKYPNSVHWHFKRDAKETGLIDATYWDVKSLLWLMVRHREPEWVQKTAPKLHRALRQEAKALGGA